MSDYISKGKLMSHIESQYRSFGEDYDALQILGDIEDFPTEERPHGEWIDLSDGWQEGTFRCSSCQMEFVLLEGTPEDNEYNFCPNCGARMKGGDEK